MRNRENNTITTGWIVNLTGEPFIMYEESTGNILILIPNTEKLPKVNHSNEIFYVVKKEQIEKLRKKGRSLNDIAFICSEDEGYAKIHFCALASAKDPNVRIRLRRSVLKPQHKLPYLDESLLYVVI